MKPDERLLICGASARAAAASAVRADLQPFAIDLFNDTDLLELCPAQRISLNAYPHGLEQLARDAPPGPWLYTGGLENHPDVVAAISQHRLLWGNDADVLRLIRDPFRVARTLHEAGLSCPEVLPAGAAAPTDGTWLIKPLAGSGGSGIAPWRGQKLTGRLARGHYLQRRVHGNPHAAIYFGDDETALLLGVTRQLVGEPWLHAKPFAYCGSIGPAVVPDQIEDQLVRVGVALVRGFRLRGLFGVDFLLDQGQAWLVEVNPRYTASVEVLEIGLDEAFFRMPAEHFGRGARCVEFLPAWGKPRALLSRRRVVKVVYFAGQATVYDIGPRELSRGCADVPQQGTPIAAGQPVLTLLEAGATVEECLDWVRYVAGWLDRRLYRQ